MNKTLVAWIIIAAAIIAGLVVYPDMPEQLPIHWNVNNEVDDYASKAFALFFLPGMMIFMVIINYLMPKIDRKNLNKPNMKSSLSIIQNTVLLGMLVLHGFTIAFGYGYEMNIGKVVTPFIGILFIAIGNYMPRLTPNYLAGIKTPKTLKSEFVWRKTHQTSAKIFVVGGLLMIGLVFVPAPLQSILLIITTVIVALPSVLLPSYYAKKENSNK